MRLRARTSRGLRNGRWIYARGVPYVPKHRRSRFRSVICCVVVSLLAAGCGSSYTKADFVKRADGICTATTRIIRSLTPPQFGAGSALQRRSSAAYFRHAAAIVEKEARQLSALPKPPANAAQRHVRSQWLAAVRDSAGELRSLADATAAGNSSAVTAANRRLAANPVVALATRYGSKACAGPGATYQ
jgi:hypothetical protein